MKVFFQVLVDVFNFNLFEFSVAILEKGSCFFNCAYIELWLHLGSLESTQVARVALGYCLEQLLRFVRAQLPACIHNSIYAR